MDATSTFKQLDDMGIAPPKQMILRDIEEGKLLDEADRTQLLVKRVKKGEEHLEKTDSAEHYACYIARIHYWAELRDILAHNEVLALHDWSEEALHRLAKETLAVCTHWRPLIDLFMEKGKLLIHGSGAPYVSPKYVTKNHTLEVHLVDWMAPLQTTAIRPNLFAHIIAQHLDYPEDTGKRRHSTSVLFDSCFNGEKALGEQTLAAQIDKHLAQHWLVHSGDGAQALDHTLALLDGERPQTNSSRDRVRQRERFAAMIEYFVGGSKREIISPILAEYMKLVHLDLQYLAKRSDPYPLKKHDEIAEALHQPLAVIFKQNANDNNEASNGTFVKRIQYSG